MLKTLIFLLFYKDKYVMGLKKLKVKYAFIEGKHPDRDMQKVFDEIRDFYFKDWLEEVFFAEYDEEVWDDNKAKVIDFFLNENKGHIERGMTEMQKKLYSYPEMKEKLNDILAGV